MCNAWANRIRYTHTHTRHAHVHSRRLVINDSIQADHRFICVERFLCLSHTISSDSNYNYDFETQNQILAVTGWHKKRKRVTRMMS